MNALPAFGKEAPDFVLPGTDGKDLALRSVRGRTAVLLFYCYDFGSI